MHIYANGLVKLTSMNSFILFFLSNEEERRKKRSLEREKVDDEEIRSFSFANPLSLSICFSVFLSFSTSVYFSISPSLYFPLSLCFFTFFHTHTTTVAHSIPISFSLSFKHTL